MHTFDAKILACIIVETNFYDAVSISAQPFDKMVYMATDGRLCETERVDQL